MTELKSANANDALIGHSGFVGGSILQQRTFGHLYNSKNIENIQGKKFDMVICAGAPGTKWIANQNPQQDLSSIQRLVDNLKKIACKRLILISTIDVYSPVNNVTENTAIVSENLQPYAKHRRYLEEFAEQNFNSTIIRLPGIFGTGLKKNVIFDLAHGLEVRMHPSSLLQFYWLKYIWKDIQITLENKIKKINFATEPLTLRRIAEDAFGISMPESSEHPITYYDMRTIYAGSWGMEIPYLYTQNDVARDIKMFAESFAS